MAVIVRDAGAEPCVAHVHLAGTAAAIERVATALKELGVAIGPPHTGCRTVEANVELDPEGGIAVAVETAGRTEARVVSDPAMAAAWLDSWVRDDGVDAPEPAPALPRDSLRVAATPPSHSFVDDISASGDYEQVWTDDGTSWTGGSIAACTRLGDYCVGARVRARFQSSLTVNLATASRYDLSAMVTASRAFEVGRVIASPEVGVGVGRMSTSRIDCPPPQMEPNCPDPTDPMCSPAPGTCADAAGNKIYVGDNLHAVTYTPRLAAALRLALPLFDRVWLDVLAEVTYAPFGHGEAFPAMMTGTTMSDPQLALPGEPERAVQLGVGLRVGAP